MSNNIRNLHEHNHSSKSWTIRQMLDSITEEDLSESTAAVPNLLDNRDGKYHTLYNCSGLSMSEQIALLEMAKLDLFVEHTYLG